MRQPDTDQQTAHAHTNRATPGTCPDCGWPDTAVHEVLSHHRTSEGLVTWARCQCGALQVRLHHAGPSETVARGRTAGD